MFSSLNAAKLAHSLPQAPPTTATSPAYPYTSPAHSRHNRRPPRHKPRPPPAQAPPTHMPAQRQVVGAERLHLDDAGLGARRRRAADVSRLQLELARRAALTIVAVRVDGRHAELVRRA